MLTHRVNPRLPVLHLNMPDLSPPDVCCIYSSRLAVSCGTRPRLSCLTLPWQILLIVQIIHYAKQVNNGARYFPRSIFITRPTSGRYVNLPRCLRNRQTQLITQCFKFFRFHMSCRLLPRKISSIPSQNNRARPYPACLNAVPGSTCYWTVVISNSIALSFKTAT